MQRVNTRDNTARLGEQVLTVLCTKPQSLKSLVPLLQSKIVVKAVVNSGSAVNESSIASIFLVIDRAARCRHPVPGGRLGGEDIPLPEAISHKRAEFSNMLIRDSGFAVKLFDAMVRELRAERSQCW